MSDREFREKFVKDRKVTWRVYVAATVLGVIGVFLEQEVHGISRFLGSAGAALLGVMVVKRRYWGFWWFWATFGALVTFQVPLVIFTKPLMDYLKFLFMWPFAIVDLFAMSLAVEVVADYFEVDRGN